MLYKYIIGGYECWLSAETIDAIENDSLTVLERCYKSAIMTGDWETYVNLYKDYHGTKPRN